MTAVALDPGAQPEPHRHLAVARERTSGSPASIGALAFASNPDWSYLADRQAPSYSAPVIVGQAGRAAWEKSAQQITDDWSAARAENAAEESHDGARRAAWERDSHEHTIRLHAAAVIPGPAEEDAEDSAGPGEGKPSGPAEASTGEAE